MDKKKVFTYMAVFAVSALLFTLFPLKAQHTWQTFFIAALSALLYTLLVFLSCRLLGISRPEGTASAAVFMLLFLPSSESFMSRDAEALLSLCSQCIVPFFISQYQRVSKKNFRRIYMLMLLMGIFCSYTHNGITIPLCAGFLWLWYIHRKEFFRTACWPMVIGFVIGTSVSIVQAVTEGTSGTTANLQQSISQTTVALRILWDTKVFLIALALTTYLSISRWGRSIMLECAKRHQLLASCLAFSFCTLPFAPLGLDNAVSGVCFFCMYWVLILAKPLAAKAFPQQWKDAWP